MHKTILCTNSELTYLGGKRGEITFALHCITFNSLMPEISILICEKAFGDSRQQQQQPVRTRSSPTPVTDMPSLDDSTFKVGRLSAEERKEKIHRYMKKRNERNFSKKIKVKSSVSLFLLELLEHTLFQALVNSHSRENHSMCAERLWQTAGHESEGDLPRMRSPGRLQDQAPAIWSTMTMKK